eukprot:7319828-Pyramimonas_sp.AAC.1
MRRGVGARPKCRSLPEAAVPLKTRTANSKAEMTMRRLRQWQRFAQCPNYSRQPLAALFRALDGLEGGSTFPGG